MEEARILPTEPPKPTITLGFSAFPSFKRLNAGDKGNLNIKAVICLERVEGERIVKTLRLSDIKPNKVRIL